MTGNCIHGFAPGTCLICQTMDTQKTLEAHKAQEIKSPTRTGRSVLRSGPRVVPKEAPPTGSPTTLKLIGLAIAVVIAIVVAWTVLHLVFAVVKILAMLGVALLAGYIGWLAGVYHGRRTAHREH